MLNNIAGVVAGFKAGEITESVAKQQLRSLGVTDDNLTSLLSLAAGAAVGYVVGDVVSDLLDDWF
jgi:phage-related minor tail protein